MKLKIYEKINPMCDNKTNDLSFHYNKIHKVIKKNYQKIGLS